MSIGKTSFTITKGASNRGKGKNVPTLWDAFCAMLIKVFVSDETMLTYIEGTQDFRNEVKSKAGWYIACATEGGHRTADTLYPRQIMTIDVDEPTPELWEAVKNKTLSPLNEYEYFAHLTKSATKRKPKFRIIILSCKPVQPDHFRNLNTILCLKLVDPTLNSIDDVCFRPAQIMYLPVVSKDQTYEWVRNSGRAVDPYRIAEDWGIDNFADWNAWLNFALIPASERQGKRRETQRRAERPREKDNIVGAFCRQFSVEDAIVEFDLPYEPTEGSWSDNRYTYTLGSGSGGAVVYDDGDFLYSNHQSDPCGEMGVNAFDLVRLHKFKDEDKDVSPDDPPQAKPSFKAMSKLATSFASVRGDLLASRIDSEAMLTDDDVAPEDEERDLPHDEVDVILASEGVKQAMNGHAVLDDESLALIGIPTSAPPKNWMADLDVTENGTIKTTSANVAIILVNDSRTWQKIGWNEMTDRKMLRKRIVTKVKVMPSIPIRNRVDGDHFEDKHRIGLRLLLESPAGKGLAGYGLKVPTEMLSEAVEVAALANPFHPVKDFLARHTWDGTPRLDTLFIRYLGLEDSEYHREVARLTMLAIITRVFEPGHKFDYSPVLFGVTGCRKSTFVRMLGMGMWFAELTADMSDPKACVEQMRGGAVVMELPELANLSKQDVNVTKGFLSRMVDEVRLAYGRENTIWLRRNIFMGTTNNSEYLRDPTGNRRIWPIQVGRTMDEPIDTEAMLLEMPQVYAEAHAAYLAMREAQPHGSLPLYLRGKAAQAAAEAAQAQARVETAEDVLAGQIREWIDTPIARGRVDEEFEDDSETMVLRTRVCGAMVWTQMMGRDIHHFGRADQFLVGAALAMIDGFRPPMQHRFESPWGRQRWRTRDGADSFEIARGYAVIEPPDDPLI